MDRRKTELAHWVACRLPELNLTLDGPVVLLPASSDASSRRYFRFSTPNGSLIAVDAPPATENNQAFIAIAAAWHAYGIQVPLVFASDLEQGFLLVADLGSSSFFQRVNESEFQLGDGRAADELYRRALELLLRIQSAPAPSGYQLPEYDAAFLSAEMALCNQWFLEGLLGLQLSTAESELLQATYKSLCDSAMAQPRVCVHRDYHSRNLMVEQDGALAVLDFQGAVLGPITYDVASLLRDCYLSWPPALEQRWLAFFLDALRQRGALASISDSQFQRWFDWMGLQRHIKCLGIFSRLFLRDHKDSYLKDLPRTLDYVSRVCAYYPELAAFNSWLQARVVPALVALAQRQDMQAVAEQPRAKGKERV